MAKESSARLIATAKVAAADGTWAQGKRKGKLIFISGQEALDGGGTWSARTISRLRPSSAWTTW